MRPPQLVGAIIARRWELIEEIGRGGFGVVYRARHIHTKVDAAVKVLNRMSDPVSARRFATEVQVPARLGEPPGLARVLDAGPDERGWLYVAMELLRGFTLADRAQALDLFEILTLVRDMLGSLALAHEGGFVHRDLKPDNVFVLEEPDRGVRTKLLDFGIAKWLNAEENTTVPFQIVGTVRYLSPERASGRPVTAASDVWSVGVMLYELLAGVPPYQGDGALAVILAIARGGHAPLRDHAPWCPLLLAELVERCLAPEPTLRPPDARALRTALELTLKDRDVRAALVGRRSSSELERELSSTIPVGAPTDPAPRSPGITVPTTAVHLRRSRLSGVLAMGLVAMLALAATAVALALRFGPSRQAAPPETRPAIELSGDPRQRACDSADYDACFDLGHAYANGEEGVRRDEGLARALYERACNGGIALACNDLGVLHENGRAGLPPSAEQARALYERACAGGAALGCNNLAAFFETGRGGVAPDGDRARALYQRACDHGVANGCESLGTLYENGSAGAPLDLAQARHFYERACDSGDAVACESVGDLSWESDPAAARPFYRRACDLFEATDPDRQQACDRATR